MHEEAHKGKTQDYRYNDNAVSFGYIYIYIYIYCLLAYSTVMLDLGIWQQIMLSELNQSKPL